MSITKEMVIKALSTVDDPDFKKDLVTLNMIKDVEVNNQNISFTVVLTTPACPLKDKIENDCREAIAKLVDANAIVTIKMDSKVTSPNLDKLNIPGVKNIIAVVSGKGGVGKSTVASNLALALSELGAKVGLLDADIYGPSIPIMFGVHESPEIQVINGKNRILPVERHNIKLMSIGFMVQPNQAVAWRGPMISNALRQFVNDTLWGELDYLVLDLPPGTGDIHLTMGQIIPVTGFVLVTTPQDVAVADAIKAAVMFDMMPTKTPFLGVIENMSWFTPAELPQNKYYIFGDGGGKRIASQFNTLLLGQVPLVASVREGADKGMPAVLDDTNPAKSIFIDLAKQTAQQLAILNANQLQQNN
ncbi:MAG: Mrp/NBP35 family ATP-binding protein [Bacteroidia bacterium]|nr:Mrp/NBP35 family ATP-binding protein [Bacteroidia bacterium]